MKRTLDLLPQVSFSILLALSLKPRHGYEIVHQVEDDSLSKIKLGPGTLYGAIKQLSQDNLIEEVPSEIENDRRRHYRLTLKGWNRLTADLEYFKHTIKLAKNRRI